LVAGAFRRRDGVQQGAALLRHLFGHLLGSSQFDGQFFLAADEFGDMALGVALAGVPAPLFVADDGKTPRAGFAFAAQRFQGAARLAGLGAGIGGLAAGLGDLCIVPKILGSWVPLNKGGVQS